MGTVRIGAVRIGISGWRYAPWRGVFYPTELRQRDELAFASRALPTIELNGSFYSLQPPQAWQRWHDDTPEGFVFAVKGPRYITHLRRLKDVRVPLANFFASGLLALGDKLGPLLWQFPPQLPFLPDRFDAFCAMLPRDTQAAVALAREHDAHVDGHGIPAAPPHRRLRHAIEVRHPGFVDPAFIGMLRRHGIALVVADTAGHWPLIEDLTAGFVYVRLHGDEALYASGYGDAALDHWAARITAWRAGRQVGDAKLAAPGTRGPQRASRDVYVYFDNDVKVHAPYDAARLAERLGVATGLRADAVFEPPQGLPEPREHAPGFGRRAPRPPTA